MNRRYVIKLLGMGLFILSALMLVATLPGIVAWATGPRQQLTAELAMLAAALGGGTAALLCWTWGARTTITIFGRREALLLVALMWLVGSFLAAWPFYLWALWADVPAEHAFRSFISCYFEATSGLTTTGSTVVQDLSTLPGTLLLWRSLSQWLGGIGIVVMFVAVLPTLGVGGKRLFQIEVSEPRYQGVRPRIVDTARILCAIYLVFTLTLILIYRALGMTWFDAVSHSFTTIATAGFSPHGESMGYFDSFPIHMVAVAFMILGSINFSIYYQLVRRRLDLVWRDQELRLYLTLLLGGSALIAAALYGMPLLLTDGTQVEAASAGQAIQHGTFNFVSIISTTGYATAGFEYWGFLPQAILMLAILIGGCGGSTAGGLKVIRILVLAKIMKLEIERVFRPHVVRTTKVGNRVVDPEMRQAVLTYIVGIALLMGFCTIAIQLLETGTDVTFTTAATGTIQAICNIGPGLGQVGAMGDYSLFSRPSQLLLSLLMILGRLEVYAIFVLFVPAFWRSD